MGTFAEYTGEMNITKEKRECFGRQMMKLLNYGGMMQIERVLLFERELILLSPVEVSGEGNVDFWYNYFEDSSWENAGFYMNNSIFYSNKIGGANLQMLFLLRIRCMRCMMKCPGL